MSSNTARQPLRLHIPLDPADEQGLDTEAIWVTPLGTGPQSDARYQLAAVPLFAFGLSANDIVRAEKVGDQLEFRELLEPSGHSTYRLYLQNRLSIRDEDFILRWQPIAALGARYEAANNHFLAIDIPPTAALASIYDLLEAGEADGLWEFEEGNYAGNDALDTGPAI